MKKFIYISGIVLINIIVLGVIFKTQHWPGAGVMLVFGQILFAFCFLPLAIINSYWGNGKKNKSLYIAGFICAVISIIGILFKVQHYPGGAILMMIGIPLPFIYFLPVYIYHHNKSKEKSSMNFLGVMFLMVFIALFSSMLAINVSKRLLDSMIISTNDFSKTAETYTIKNLEVYESIEKSGKVDNTKLSELKKKTEAVSEKIENIKMELAKRIMGDEFVAANKNKKNVYETNPLETNVTSFIMNSDDNTNGRATEIKNSIADYRKYLNSILSEKKESLLSINLLLNTSDIATVQGEVETWENHFFQRNTYFVSVIGNLDCIETNVKMAEAEALSNF
jgi:hypothetical protein